MEIDVTSLLESDQFALSHSQAEGGSNAGRNTWQASLERAEETALLNTPEKREAIRPLPLPSGGWSAEEIAEWIPQESNALFLQWIAGDCRQCPAILEGVTFEEREGQWWHSDESEPDMETGPFDSRSEAYADACPIGRAPRADSLEKIDWPEYETQASAGHIPGNLFRADDGRIFFYLGN
jgi:hypothetical protein